MDLFGKSRAEIARLTKKKSRSQLVDELYRHCTLPPSFSPETIAKAKQISPKTIKRLMKQGVIAASELAGNRLRASLAAVLKWERDTALTLAPEEIDQENQ